MIARKRYWIAPEFQSRMILQWTLLVLMSNLCTNLITLGFVRYQDSKIQGEFLYVSQKVGASPIVTDPVPIKRHQLVIPTLLTSLILGFGISVLAGVFYSHRLAGPIYRIQKTLKEAEQGKPVQPILLRHNDEFRELADDLNRLLGKRGP